MRHVGCPLIIRTLLDTLLSLTRHLVVVLEQQLDHLDNFVFDCEIECRETRLNTSIHGVDTGHGDG